MSSKTEINPKILEAFLQAERRAMVSRLLKGVVHNLSGVIQQVRLPLDLIELHLSQDQIQEAASTMDSVQAGVTKLTEELQLLAGRSSQDCDDEIRELELSTLIEEQLAFWPGDMFFKHEARVETDLPYLDTRTKAPYMDVALAFNALLANALESLKESGENLLRINLADQGEMVWILIEDHGPGPNPDLGDSIFDPFVTTKDAEHPGLGLFLARKALEKWGGIIKHQGNEPCVFAIGLPRQG
ncbi:ATP-binding protein [Dethiosulfatarculus sandiegensis]|uniref:histidine kinase n=1 Tax=Dethiosulfatarculus sandiegensis TaxID=1429043 RepID=A0A0D2GKY5_9BACT|nr:ATP-binding protein [Dethiosulfatarculus sandiegensis]KIX15392.1 hypothetical protein X474_03475 [Dethiosulfatarculus sandiegensis]